MRVLGDTILFPLSCFVGVLHQTGVDISDSPTGKAEGVAAEETMEVIIDELPVEGEVVRNKDGAAFGVLIQPDCEFLHNFLWIIEGEVWFGGEAADRQSLGKKPVRNRPRLAVERFVQGFVEEHGPETDHGKLGGNWAIG